MRNFRFNKIYVVLAVVFLLAAGCNSKKSQNTPVSPTPTPPSATKTDYKLALEDIPVNKFGDPEDNDIVKIDNKSGKRTVLISSTRAITNFHEFNRDLKIFSDPENLSKIWVHEILDATDAPPGPIWVFDANTNKLTKLSEINSSIETTAWMSVSPDGLVAVAVSKDGKKISLADLDKDKLTTLVTLNDTQTLNSTENPFGPSPSLRWTDSNTIQYNIYDGRVQITDPSKSRPLLETKSLKVK